MTYRLQLTEDSTFVDGLSNEIYHGPSDPPSLSNSGAKIIMDACPRKFWFNSPLNPKFVPERKAAFDIGTAGHLLFLEHDKFKERTVIIDADSYRSNAAKEAREEAYATNRTPLLADQALNLIDMRKALEEDPVGRTLFDLRCNTERSLFWKDAETGVFLKCRNDWERHDAEVIVDYKTTTNAAPKQWDRAYENLRYYNQAAWYMEGAKRVYGKSKTRRFWFLVQEIEPPYLVTVRAVEDCDLEAGWTECRKAIDIFADCLETGNWYGYRDPDHPDRDRAIPVRLSNFARQRFAERDEKKHFFTRADFAAMSEFQSPLEEHVG